MSGDFADHPHSENEAIARASVVALLERMERIEKQVDWLMENILYRGDTLGKIMEDNHGQKLK